MSIKTYFTLITTVLGLFILSSCDDNNCIVGEGPISTSTLSLSNFSGISLDIAANVTVSQGATQEVILTGHQNIIRDVVTSVSNDFWAIRFPNNKCYSDYELSIQVIVPEINKLHLNGSGDITVNEFSGLTNLEVELKGSGRMNISEVINNVNSLDIDISGSGNYNGFDLSCENATIDISGSGEVELTVSNQLDVDISGSGNVYYKGNPTISQNISGSGGVIDAN